MPPRVCFCEVLTSVPTRTRILIVRHAAEINKTSNTGRLAALALANSVLVDHGVPQMVSAVVGDFGKGNGATSDGGTGEAQGLDLTGELGDRPWVLAPGGAVLTAPPDVGTLVVIDCTWATAKSMRWRLPPLASVPTLSLPAPTVAPMRMRRGAEPEHMATIEAIAAALEFLGEPEPAAHLRALQARMAGVLLALRGFPMPEKRR